MRSPSAVHVGTIAAAGMVGPFVAMWLYLVLLLRAGIYLPHADLASWAGLALSLAVGLVFLWQLPLRRLWRIACAALYLVCLTPLLIVFGILTVCRVTGDACP